MPPEDTPMSLRDILLRYWRGLQPELFEAVGEYQKLGGQAAAFSISGFVFAALKSSGYQDWNFAFSVQSSTRVLV